MPAGDMIIYQHKYYSTLAAPLNDLHGAAFFIAHSLPYMATIEVDEECLFPCWRSTKI
jgi:hypothetical protein